MYNGNNRFRLLEIAVLGEKLDTKLCNGRLAVRSGTQRSSSYWSYCLFKLIIRKWGNMKHNN